MERVLIVEQSEFEDVEDELDWKGCERSSLRVARSSECCVGGEGHGCDGQCGRKTGRERGGLQVSIGSTRTIDDASVLYKCTLFCAASTALKMSPELWLGAVQALSTFLSWTAVDV